MTLISDVSTLMDRLSFWCHATRATQIDEEVLVGELEGRSCLKLDEPEKERTGYDGSTEAGSLASDLAGDSSLPEEEQVGSRAAGVPEAAGASSGGRACASSTPAWWSGVDITAHRGLEEAAEISRLLDVSIVKHPPITRTSAPWLHGQSDERYEAMGIRSRGAAYVAVWLNLGNISLLTAAEVTDHARLEACLAGDPMRRLKILLHPVRLPLNVPCPTKSARDADAMGAYFGAQHSSCVRGRTASGADYTRIQVDLHSKMILRLLLQKFAFREGNVVEFLVVDWEGKSVLSAIRLNVTAETLKLLS